MASRVQVIAPPSGDASGTVQVRVAVTVPVLETDPRTPPAVDAALRAGASGRTLVMSETVDSRWRWSVNDVPVTPAAGPGPPTDPSLQQAGVVADAVPVTITFDGSSRTTWLWIEAAVLALVVLLALPSRRRVDDDDDDSDVDAVSAPIGEAAEPDVERPAPEPDRVQTHDGVGTSTDADPRDSGTTSDPAARIDGAGRSDGHAMTDAAPAQAEVTP